MTGGAETVAVLVWNVFAAVIWVWAIVEVLRTPAPRFAAGWRTKTVRLVMIAVLTATIAGIYLPAGAAVILAGLRRTRRNPPTGRSAPAAPQLPYHPGGFTQPHEP